MIAAEIVKSASNEILPACPHWNYGEPLLPSLWILIALYQWIVETLLEHVTWLPWMYHLCYALDQP